MITYPKTIFDFCFQNQSLLYLKESIFITIGELGAISITSDNLGSNSAASFGEVDLLPKHNFPLPLLPVCT
jgi:hypothetical protein